MTTQPIRNPDRQAMPFFVNRDFNDEPIEVAVEILGYHGKEQGGCWDEVLGPSVELGDAFYLDGRECVLTPLEREAAAEQALKQIATDAAETIFQRERN